MSTNTEKTFKVVGTAINPNGELKVRWANDLVQRINILIKAKCDEINLHETPEPMTKLNAIKWLRANVVLTPEQEEVVDLKIAEKDKQLKRVKVKSELTEKINNNVKENKKTDPRVAKFINRTINETVNRPNKDSEGKSEAEI